MALNKLTKILLSTQVDELYFRLGEDSRDSCILAAGELVNGVGLTGLVISGLRFIETEDGKVMACVDLFPNFSDGKSDGWWDNSKEAYKELKQNLKKGFHIYGNEED